MLQFFSDLGVLLDLLDQHFSKVGILIEIIADDVLYFIYDSATDITIAQLVFCLRLKDRLLDFHSDGADYAFPYILSGKLLAGKLVDPFQNPFTEGGKMRASIIGIGSVYKRKITLAIAVCMGKGKFQGLVLKMDRIVELRAVDLVLQKIKKPVVGVETFFPKIES